MNKILLPLKRKEWMPSSQAEKRNFAGHRAIERRWHVSARLDDGFIRWTGTFEDREEFDAFLWAIACNTLNQEPELWRYPTPAYCPEYGEGALLVIAASITITSGTSQSVPGDWNNATNTIEAIGGGGSGAVGCRQTGNRCMGGSGAEYRKLTNYTASGTFSYTIGAGGTVVTLSTAGRTSGVDGGDTILDTTALIAKKGLAGIALGVTGSGPAGGTGGSGGSGFDGGAGGSTSHNDCSTGGGGAGGPGGAGGAGDSSATAGGNNTGSNGGTGGNGSGGGGGARNGTAATASATPITATNGGVGSDITTGIGSGGGGGGAENNGTGAVTGGTGGTYGAGGGGANNKNGSAGTSTSGAGAQGVIYITYTPLVISVFNGNLPMMGL